MVKKLKKDEKGFSLEISKAIVEAMGISQKTDLEFVVMDGALIIKPKDKSSAKKRKIKLENLTNRLIEQYGPVLKKLAKT